MTNSQAIDVFIRSFAFTRSFTRPAELASAGPLPVVRDVVRDDDDVRREEIYIPNQDAESAHRAILKYASHRNYRICVFHPMDVSIEDVRKQYRALGYRPRAVETLFVRDLKKMPAQDKRIAVTRVRTMQEAERVRQYTRYASIRQADLECDPPIVRLYSHEIDGETIAYCRSVQLSRDASYVAGLATLQKHRRKGIATALMTAMLHDAKKAGAKHSVLVASSSGALLYPHLGYKALLYLQVFTPARQKLKK